MESTDKKIDILASVVGTLAGEMDNLTSVVAQGFKRMEKGFKEADKKIEHLDKKMGVGFKRADEKIEAGFARADKKMEAGFARADKKMETGFKKADERTDDLAASVANGFKDVYSRFDRVDARLERHDEEFGYIRERFTYVDERFDSVEKSMATKADLANLHGNLTAIFDVEIDLVRKEQRGLGVRVDALETKIA